MADQESGDLDNATDPDPKSKFGAGFHEYFRSGRLLRRQPRVDSDGLVAVSLEMLFGEQTLALGSGFFWRLPQAVALVTAWHNFSGLHHTLRKPMARHGGVPDRVRIKYMAKRPQQFQEQMIPLYLDDDMAQPRWLVHKQCGSFFDIAFVMLFLNDHDVFCVNDGKPIFDGDLLPGSDVFVIGYPQGISSIGAMPIWRRGSVASEIDLPFEGHPKFLIDVAGRRGLSGAAVYRIQRGFISGPSEAKFGIGSKTEFLGLYSGRAADQLPVDERPPESSDLGFVWRPEMVAEVLQFFEPDEKPEPGKGRVIMTPTWEKASARDPGDSLGG